MANLHMHAVQVALKSDTCYSRNDGMDKVEESGGINHPVLCLIDCVMGTKWEALQGGTLELNSFHDHYYTLK